MVASVPVSGSSDGSLPEVAIENLVIVGSGPAGYTAAIYAARANLAPLLITGFQRGGIPGGQLMTTTHVENYPGFPDGILGPELMDRCKAQALRWGTKLLEADAESLDLSVRPYRLVTSEGETVWTHSLILATGASANRLGITDEERFWSRGISACAICDGATPQFRKEQLAVVGGGDSACEEAVYLTKYGSQVHLIVRSDRLRASAAMADRVLANPAITVHWNREVVDGQGLEGATPGPDGEGPWLASITLRNRSSGATEQLATRRGLNTIRGCYHQQRSCPVTVRRTTSIACRRPWPGGNSASTPPCLATHTPNRGPWQRGQKFLIPRRPSPRPQPPGAPRRARR